MAFHHYSLLEGKQRENDGEEEEEEEEEEGDSGEEFSLSDGGSSAGEEDVAAAAIMEQMDRELAATAVGRSFEKVKVCHVIVLRGSCVCEEREYTSGDFSQLPLAYSTDPFANHQGTQVNVKHHLTPALCTPNGLVLLPISSAVISTFIGTPLTASELLYQLSRDAPAFALGSTDFC